MRHTRYAKGFHRGSKTGPNKTEAAYGAYLALRERAGEISGVQFESLTLKIGPDVRYTPDYICMSADGVIECHEVKAGRIVRGNDKNGNPTAKAKALTEDASRIKIRVAAEKFPFRFVVACLAGGRWHLEQV